MFNDERINLEMGKLKKIIILVSVIISFLFCIKKIIYTRITNFFPYNFYLYLTELLIIISGLIIILIPIFKKHEIKDELYYQEKANYYNKVFKIFLLIVFGTFALSIPGTIYADEENLSSSITLSLLLNATLFIGYGYLRYKNIYFNYNIIENSKNEYYKQVFKNILKLLVYCVMIYGIAIIPAIFYLKYIDPLTMILSIILGCVVTFLNNSLFYLCTSALERLFYKEENSKRITTPTVILLIIAFILFIVSFTVTVIYNNLIRGNINGTEVIIVKFKNICDFMCHLKVLFGLMAIIFLVYDMTKINNELMKKFNVPLIILIILGLYILCGIYVNFGDLLFYITINYDIKFIPLREIYAIGSIFNFIINLTLHILIIIFSWKSLKNYVKSKKTMNTIFAILLIIIIMIKCFSMSSFIIPRMICNTIYILLVSTFALILIIKYFSKNNIIGEAV